MAKPITTKQHLIDKLILGQLPLHKRHGRMSQYGGNGKQDQKLEDAFTSIEFDTANLTIDEQCELRAKFFLEMVEIYIEQMEDKLQQTVAKCAFRQLVAEEGRQCIVMDYSPKQLKGDKKAQYDTPENYQSILEKNYKQVAFENQISKMLSSIIQSVPKDSMESWNDSVLNTYCRVVQERIFDCYTTHEQRKNKVDKIFIGDPSITPEEYSELQKNGQRKSKDDEIFISGLSITPEEYSELQKIYKLKIRVENSTIYNELEMAAQSLIDEIQAKYDPDKCFYSGYFGSMIRMRIDSIWNEYYKEESIDDIVDSMKFLSPEESEKLRSRDEPDVKMEQQQTLSLIQDQLTPQEYELLVSKASGATHAEIAATINRGVLREQIKKGEVKPIKTSNIQYGLKKLEERLEKFLRSKGILSADESLQLSRRNKKPSVKKTDDILKEGENNE